VSICKFQFSWWSRDHFSVTSRSLYFPNAWSQTLQTSKRHTFSVSSFHRYHWFGDKTVSCRLCAGQLNLKGTLKREKNAVLDLDPPMLQNFGIFHDSTRPHVHFGGLPIGVGCVTTYKYYKKNSRFGLAWSHPRTDRSLSRPTSVFRTTICLCKILSRSVEIWQ